MFDLLFLISGSILCFVSMLFVISILVKRNDIADTAWGIGILLVAAISYAQSVEKGLLLSIVLVLIMLWSVRLFVSILLRNIKKDEDYRYKNWRMQWGKWFYIRSYFQVYVLQGFLMIVVGYPAIHASVYGVSAEFGLIVMLGAVVWAVGYVFEVVGDWQLDRFIKGKPEKGTIMDRGFWKYTRHPNYFGEVTMWWGLWIMVATLPFGYFALISPFTITFLILKVSGIPMLERSFADNPNFQAYKKRTSAFFPLPPRK
ncbi:MAG: steroid 5-alpha reductase family enzyme [Candidatus Azotimanducaceae bacterium]|jgi:steroid 5-alpha reductase family enzyme